MKESKSNNIASEKMTEFEELGLIQPSEEWNNQLMGRISTSKSLSRNKNVSLSRIAIILLIMTNLGFMYKIIRKQSGHSNQRNTDLQVISNELLINPISSNN